SKVLSVRSATVGRSFPKPPRITGPPGASSTSTSTLPPCSSGNSTRRFTQTPETACHEQADPANPNSQATPLPGHPYDPRAPPPGRLAHHRPPCGATCLPRPGRFDALKDTKLTS